MEAVSRRESWKTSDAVQQRLRSEELAAVSRRESWKTSDAVSLWQFHVNIMWSRIQTATVIEAGVLAAWYQLWGDERHDLARGVLTFGAFLLVLVSLLARRDAQYIQACEDCCNPEVPSPGKPLISLPLLRAIRGRWLAVWTIFLLAVTNIVLAALY